MAKKCPKCHHENPDDTLFCGKCGTQFLSPEKAEVTETLETPKEELTTGSTFAERYQIIEELGKGGMGRVYKVLDKETNDKISSAFEKEVSFLFEKLNIKDTRLFVDKYVKPIRVDKKKEDFF